MKGGIPGIPRFRGWAENAEQASACTITLKASSSPWFPVEYPVVVEHDPQTGHFTATVPGLPGIVVDAKTERTALKLAREAIALWQSEPGAMHLDAKVVTVSV